MDCKQIHKIMHSLFRGIKNANVLWKHRLVHGFGMEKALKCVAAFW